MPALVECVPNFSEGRDSKVIDAIAAAIRAVAGVQLLDVDPGADTNRTVMTFVGAPDDVIEAAFQAIKTAGQLIDMRQHHGAHPRMGATDVCPLIPIEGVDVQACVALAERLGERVGRELDIPVYLYEQAARSEQRRNLAVIRAGEYEGFERKMADGAWKPDFGAGFNARSGATVIGVREFLIAYNVNLNTTDKKLASDIALTIRETGRLKRTADGEIEKDAEGNQVRVAGLFGHVKAVGWYIEQYRQAQVSINLTNYKITPPHVVFDAVRAEAEKRGLVVTGSELVGLIPLEALRMAGLHYLRKQGRSSGVPEEEVVEMAVRSLGLDQLAPFDAKQKVIEYRFRSLAGPLASLSVREFCNVLSTDSPAPGGGSAAALAASLGASLVSMVGSLTANIMPAASRTRQPELFADLVSLAEQAQGLKDECLGAIDRDTDAFNVLMQAMRTKAKTDEEKAARAQQVTEATRGAIAVPFEVLERSARIIEIAHEGVLKGNPNSVSDVGVAAALGQAAAMGAWYNVCINLKDLPDAAERDAIRTRGRAVLDAALQKAREVEALMEQRLAGEPAPAAVGAGTRP